MTIVDPVQIVDGPEEQLLDKLEKEAFTYFLYEVNPQNGLVADRTVSQSPASIAAVGFALAAYPVGVERGWLSREQAVDRTCTTLRFFWNGRQGPERAATNNHGFFYHFLDMQTGLRHQQCEISTIDTTFLLAGALTAAAYFNQDSAAEKEIRDLADALYRRVDWGWATNGGVTCTHGWRPESGFIQYRWEGYNEALLLYVLGLASPTYPLRMEAYPAWTSTYAWKEIYGVEYLYAGPLFIHQYSHMFIDFRSIRDAFMRDHASDYFENSRRATLVHQQYAIRNPKEFNGYCEDCWGLTASDGPGPTVLKVAGVEREFFNYIARGAPYGPDDGTIAPWAAITSLPFAPAIVGKTIHYYDRLNLRGPRPYGLTATLNPTFPMKGENGLGWVSALHYGINQGPIVLMMENYRSGLVWDLMRRSPYVKQGLTRAGFTGGWLEGG